MLKLSNGANGLKNVSKYYFNNFTRRNNGRKNNNEKDILLLLRINKKIYSKIDPRHPVFNKLNKMIYLLPKNSEVIEEF
jgi:hypothetical protein